MAIHHIACLGILRVYMAVTMKCRPWIVRAKSGTSFERDTRRIIAIALYDC